ncbi:MAG: MBL fold metallo-hydrolase [Clostridia bacterium]|nr:MBL fold metallo-hydrolase [Clostridia bacterium]
MNTSAVRIRWMNDACYEIRLPNGKAVLIDPYIDESKYAQLTYDDVDQADYVLISHTHFDHVVGLSAILSRFEPQIYVGSVSGMELAHQYDIPGYLMNLCSAGDEIVTEDFILRCFRGRHTKIGPIDKPSNWEENVRHEGLDPNTVALNMLGSYEYMIYELELPSKLRILVWGGAATEDAIAQAAHYDPDITIAQLPRETPEQIGRLYAAIGGRVIFPHHHDFFVAQGEAGMKIISDTVETAARLAPDTVICCPKKGVWYSVQTGIDPVE